MGGLFKILSKIHERPGMYIGKASLEALFMFLIGYKTARRELGIEPSPEEMDFYGEFQPWLQKRLKITTSNSWAKMIELSCVTEQEAFDYFFQLLDEFLHRGDRTVSSAQNSTEPLEVRSE